MKNWLFAVIATITVAGTGASVAQPGNAQSTNSVRFYCDTRGEAPVTKFGTPQGLPEENLEVIVWKYQGFEGFPPEERCYDVSARFQTFWRNGTLNYMAAGTMNGEPVICIAPELGSNCRGLLLTLRREDNPQEVLLQLFDIRDYGAGPVYHNPSVVYDSDGRLYVDMQNYLDNKRRELLD